MRSGGRVTVDSCAIGDESCDDDNLYYGNQEVDTFQNIQKAFYLIIEAFSAFTFINYVSFIMSLGFLVLWIRSFFEKTTPSQVSRQEVQSQQAPSPTRKTAKTKK